MFGPRPASFCPSLSVLATRSGMVFLISMITSLEVEDHEVRCPEVGARRRRSKSFAMSGSLAYKPRDHAGAICSFCALIVEDVADELEATES